MTIKQTNDQVSSGQHTGGPWKWDEGFAGLNGANNEAVLRWEPYEGMWLSVLEGREEANARLIAAAPELLEALKWAVPLAEKALEDHRCLRLECGHHDIGTKRIGLYDYEVEAKEKARTLISRLGE